MSKNFLEGHTSPKISIPDWKGNHPEKFKGGRFHDNHPNDQLDTLMRSAKSTEMQPISKKQFHSQIKGGYQPDYRPHLKTFEHKYKKSTVFDIENITK